MPTFHQVIFYVLVIAVLALNVISDIKFWGMVVHHQYMKEIKEQAGVFSDLATIFNPKIVRILNTALYTLAAVLPLTLNVAIYFQARSFNSPQLSHTAATLVLLQLLIIIFQTCAWPTPAFPNRSFSKPMLVTDIALTFIGYALLICLLCQAITA